MNYDEIKTSKLTNLAHTIALLLAMAGVLGFIGWMIAGLNGIILATLFSAISLFFTPKVPVHLIMKAYGAKRIHPSSIPQLFDIIMALSKRADLKKMPAIYYSSSRVLNAVAAGSKDDSAILITKEKKFN